MNGILLVDKPADWTSHDGAAKLRGVRGERRMGHSGTLDPMATGLLVVFAGRATRAVSFSENHSKCYEARLRLGLTTDTQDTPGTVLSRCDRRVTRAELAAALPQFRGDILQTPPKYSAPVIAEAIGPSAVALTASPVCRVGSIRNTVKLLQTEGFQIVAATEKSRKLLYDADFRKPTALVMGAEDTGISKEVRKLCDEQLAIPLIGHIESLNVSAAAAVMLFEAVRQRIAE